MQMKTLLLSCGVLLSLAVYTYAVLAWVQQNPRQSPLSGLAPVSPESSEKTTCPPLPACPEVQKEQCPPAPAPVQLPKCRKDVRFALPRHAMEACEHLGQPFSVKTEIFVDAHHIALCVAAKAAGITMVETAAEAVGNGDPKLDDYAYVVRDYHWGGFSSATGGVNLEGQRRLGGSIWTMSDFFVADGMNRVGLQPGYAVLDHWSTEDLYPAAHTRDVMTQVGHRQHVWAPLGSPTKIAEDYKWPWENVNWTDRASLKIMVDEIQPNIGWVHGWNDPYARYQMASYARMMEVAKVLHEKYGYTITSFVGRNKGDLSRWNEKYPWVKVHTFEPVRHTDYIKFTREHVMIMWHFAEGYGMGFYDAWQHGIPAVAFSENIYPWVFKDGFNTVACSLKSAPDVCAAEVDNYIQHVYSKQVFEKIREDATIVHSADTFGHRIRSIMKNKGILC